MLFLWSQGPKLDCEAQANVVGHVSALTEAYVHHYRLSIIFCCCYQVMCLATFA